MTFDDSLPPPAPKAPYRPLTGMVWRADIDGEDGNAYAILANVGHIVEQVLGKAEKALYLKRAMSGDYANLMAVTHEYVAIKNVRRNSVERFEDTVQDDDEVVE